MVILSVSASFAADETDIVGIDEEDTNMDAVATDNSASALDENVGEDLSDSQKLGAQSNVVTNDTFFNYFDSNGVILNNVTADELTFEGTFSNLNVRGICITKPITLNGKNAVFNNISILVGDTNNVVIDGFVINSQQNIVAGIGITNSSNVEVRNTAVNFVDQGIDSVGIGFSGVDTIRFINNSLNYVGNTNGYAINNGVRFVDSKNILVRNNKFNISLASVPVSWVETPPSSGNWVSTVMSEGIIFKSCDIVEFLNNTVSVDYNKVIGSYDTIYAIDFSNTNNTLIGENIIDVRGFSYIYGIILSGYVFEISDNKIHSTSMYYANGIDIEGPATGLIKNNTIEVSAVSSAYPIYSSMSNYDVNVTYQDNTLYGNAYFVCGMEVAGAVENIFSNTIRAVGNYTIGIGSASNGLIAYDNKINLSSSNVGNEYIWDDLGVETAGIKVNFGNALIQNNIIYSDGSGIKVKGEKISLVSNKVNIATFNSSYAISAGNISKLCIENNTIQFIASNYVESNAVYVGNCSNADIVDNRFYISIPSLFVDWKEVPPDSGNWVGYPKSVGITIEDSNGVIFNRNNVSLGYTDFAGAYDTIYVVNVVNSNGTSIRDNRIGARGNSYIYGIILSGMDFTISDNVIAAIAKDYACGIDIEGPALGIVQNNMIGTNASSSYPIYSGMNGKDVIAEFDHNFIEGYGYFVCGMELGGSALITNSIMYLEGNYTIGIGSFNGGLSSKNNTIYAVGSNEGSEYVGDGIGAETAAIKVLDGNLNVVECKLYSTATGINAAGSIAYISDSFIYVSSEGKVPSYGILSASVNKVYVLNTNMSFTANGDGSVVTDAIYVYGALETYIDGGIFNISIPSVPVDWREIPPDSWNWVPYVMSEGIVIEKCDGAEFTNNKVYLEYNSAIGSYDTIYVIDVIDSDDFVFESNKVYGVGYSYIYGMKIDGNNFSIQEDNRFEITSRNYYACGIDIEGPSSGVVNDAEIAAIAPVAAYAVYSGMNDADVYVNFTDDLIFARAYYAVGMELAGKKTVMDYVSVNLEGNYSTGIVSTVSDLSIDHTYVQGPASGIGNLTIDDSFGVKTAGVRIVKGNAKITNGNIRTDGEYAVTVEVPLSGSTVHDNYLISKRLLGDSAVSADTWVSVYNNTPFIKTVLSAADVNMHYGDGTQYVVILKDEYSTPLANQVVYFFIGSQWYTNITNDKGVAVYDIDLEVGNYSVEAIYHGDPEKINAGSETYNVVIISEPVRRTATYIDVAQSFTRVATDFNAGERGAFFYATLRDANGNPLPNKTVQIGINGVIYKVTTDKDGKAGLQINLGSANTYTYALMYQGDDDYEATPLACSKLVVTKKSTSISASSSVSFASTAKTKTVTVTLKTTKNPYDGKTYLSKGKKITLTINGKTYSATTDGSGVAKINIGSFTKKGTFNAVIKFAGDKTYSGSSKPIKVTIK